MSLTASISVALWLASVVVTLHICCSDLSGGNVMLRNAEDCPHGNIAAKVADFGLSRIMDVQSRMQTRMYGTVRRWFSII